MVGRRRARRKTTKRIAILGWGSLLWDGGQAFDKWHGPWHLDGPELKIEFTRVSSSRLGALTLVVDPRYGSTTRVAWCLSKRSNVDDAACDLRTREGTTTANIARFERPGNATPGSDEAARAIAVWARRKRLDAVVWTALKGNFDSKVGTPFSVPAALAYVKSLTAAGKAKAAEYVWRAPDFVQTPLRTALQQEPWFEQPRDQPANNAMEPAASVRT